MDVSGRLKLRAYVRGQVAEANTPTSFALRIARALLVGGLIFPQFLHIDWERKAFAIAHYSEFKLAARLLLPNFHLQRASVDHVVCVDLGDHVSDFEPSFRSGGIWLHLSHQGSFSLYHVEELGVLRRDIGDADADVRVTYFPVTDQCINGGLHNLRGNRESHSRKGTRRRDQERIDSDDFSARVHQRTTGIALVNGCVILDELPGFARITRVRIGTIQRANNTASNGEAESKWIAECQNRLSSTQLG